MNIIKMLQKPQGKIDVVLDTDTYNEIDDQYALAYMLRSDDMLNAKAIYAAPFFNKHSSSPADGMEKSYEEILRMLTFLGRDDIKDNAYKGAKTYLADETTPVLSDAALDLAKRAMLYNEDAPLYVVAIGAITNIASALLINPDIKSRIVVVWLGGTALDWPNIGEFNMRQDIAAARVVFGCGVPLVVLPCMGVVNTFITTGPELTYWLKGKNSLCDYLVDRTIKEAESYAASKPWSRVLWDVTAVAWLLDKDNKFMRDRLEYSPIPQYDMHYSIDKNRHFIRYVYHINRDSLMEDLLLKLTR